MVMLRYGKSLAYTGSQHLLLSEHDQPSDDNTQSQSFLAAHRGAQHT